LLGDAGHTTYKRSRYQTSRTDAVVEHVLKTSDQPYDMRDFTPFGYDERQFCSPGINLEMGCLMRTPDGEFDEYHTSADNLQFITPDALADSFHKLLNIVMIFENDRVYENLKPLCEPRLGRYGLYESLPADAARARLQQAFQWVLNFSDGDHSLFDIAVRSGLEFALLNEAAERLEACDLIVCRPDMVSINS